MARKKAPTVENAASSGVSSGASVAPVVVVTQERHWIWKWLQTSAAVALVGGLCYGSREYGHMMGCLESDNQLKAIKLESENRLKAIKPLVVEVSDALDVGSAVGVSEDLASSLAVIKQSTLGIRAKIDQCGKGGHTTLAQVVDEWAAQKCGPASLIPDRVTSTSPIDSEQGRLKPKIFWVDEKQRYDLELKRRHQTNSFAGGCWEFSRHLNLVAAKQLDVVLQTDHDGSYEFKFELQDATKGQANVARSLSSSGVPRTVSVDLSKVSADILGDLARFCIAIAGTAPLAPERATIQVVSATSR